MKELEELEAFCQERGLWLTYCTYQGKWKCYVNPGTIMHEAKWYADRDEAIRAAKEAAWYNKSTEFTEEKLVDFMKAADEIVNDFPDGHVISVSVSTKEAMEHLGYNPAGELIHVKKRGRPKGSKNKPKVTADE